jgi:iron(III) transport system substrate-binding protein
MTPRIGIACCGVLWALAAGAADEYRFAAPQTAMQQLVVYGTTDIGLMTPVLRDFQALHPGVALSYTHFITRELYERFQRESGQPTAATADVLLSSAMDLQVKLVNDGFAQPHVSNVTGALPAWARWRNEAFGFTQEPVVLVYNTRQIAAALVPHTHVDLISFLRNPPVPMAGRVGTYDLVESALGYLLATQDVRQSQLAAALFGELGDNNVVLESSAARLLDRLESGELTLLYNMPGSYASARIAAGAPLGMVLLDDFTLVISHTVFIARRARNVAAAKLFVDYLLSQRGQQLLVDKSKSLSMRVDVPNVYRSVEDPTRLVAPLRPIALGPGLLVYVDDLKSQQFLRNWTASVRRIDSASTTR